MMEIREISKIQKYLDLKINFRGWGKNSKRRKVMITKERKAEVVWILMKSVIKEESIRLDPAKIKRNIGNQAKKLGVKLDELKEIFSELLTEITQEVLDELKK
jgi:hypothetical protein